MEQHVISCTLPPGELLARGERWRRLGDRAAVEVVTIPAGLRLRFTARANVEQELRELAELERECCAFAEWAVTADGSCVCLEVTAEDDAVPAVQAMFGSFRK
jgi:hypothetical protein